MICATVVLDPRSLDQLLRAATPATAAMPRARPRRRTS